MTLSRTAGLAGVIGWPVAHSLSPKLQKFWLKELGIDGAYIPLAVNPENLSLALWALPALGFKGVNITVPHKEQALALVDKTDSFARRIGAVNTISVDEKGRLIGSNTDAYGFIKNLKGEARHWKPSRPALVLGAGGAARAVCVALLNAGAREVRICNRTRSRAESMADEIGGPLVAIEWGERAEAAEGAGLLVNTTNLGMIGAPKLSMPLTKLPRSAIVTDIVYTPLMTPLLVSARERGNRIVDGLGMLLHQAQPGFTAWFGREPKVTEALRAHVLGA